jgi:hypothetical protein
MLQPFSRCRLPAANQSSRNLFHPGTGHLPFRYFWKNLMASYRVAAVNLTTKHSSNASPAASLRRPLRGTASFILLGLSLVLLFSFSALGQSQPPAPPPVPQAIAPAAAPLPASGLPGAISGTVLDRSGAAVAAARVSLTRDDHSPAQDALSGDDGQFSFAAVAPGPFHLAVTAAGFAPQTSSGILHSGETCAVQIELAVAAAVTEVRVAVPRAEVAEVEVKAEEKQRALGIIPNFYVSYVPDAVPLSPKQKFSLAWKTTVDPVNFGIVGIIAGIQQGQNHFGGYGQGAEGYGRRYGADFADSVTYTFIGSAILPSLLKQDPRYFYKGTGSKPSRFLYAVANSVICKGDNRRWQANYSSMLGGLASGGLSNLYYPANDRGAGLTFENALIGIGANAASNVFQEFVVRKLTPNIPEADPAKP